MSNFTRLLAAFLFFSQHLAAQCPVVLGCPTNTDTICILSDNNPQLWSGPQWWDPVHQTNNLAEGPADLRLQVLDTCGGAFVRYLLFLDLDGNGSLETVIDSDNPPPASTVQFNNAGSPGYTGGTSRVFDVRPVAPEEKYQFALRQTLQGDTLTADIRWLTEDKPNTFLVPDLPIGKHRVVWLIESGGTTDTCVRDIVIRDCKPPEVYCLTGLSVAIMPTGLITLWALDFLNYSMDNVTPSNRIEIGVRKLGDGTGFPLNAQGYPEYHVVFNCCDLGTQGVELWARDQAGNASFCITYITVQDNTGGCAPCGETLTVCAKTFWDNSLISDVEFNIAIGATQLLMNSMSNGCVTTLGYLQPGSSYTVSATKDHSPLNGVSTFDLVLISKHILGLEPFDAPWKMLAADVNNSGSITTFDVVELRKLILGLYDKLPNVPSWRFIPDDYVFPVPSNPFAATVPAIISVSNFNGASPVEHTFLGYKLGDVNGTAIPSAIAAPADDRTATFVTLHDRTFSAGETFDIVLRTEESAAWLGFQLAMRFASDVLMVEGVTSEILKNFDEHAWAQPEPGLLHLSWFDLQPQALSPGDNMLTIRLRALAPGRLSEAVSLSQQRLRPERYADGQPTRSLQLAFSSPTAHDPNATLLVFAPQPNPTSAGVRIPMRLSQAQSVQVEVTDLSGRVMYQQATTLDGGTHWLDLPATAFLSAGVYVWRVRVGEKLESGRVVRH